MRDAALHKPIGDCGLADTTMADQPDQHLADRRVRCSPGAATFVQDPYPAYHRMRAHGPCFYWEDYGHWCFPGFGEVNQILRDRRFGRALSSEDGAAATALPPVPQHLRPFYELEAGSMLELEPPAHTRLRGLVNRAFVSRRIEALRGRIEQLAHQLIDGFAEQHEVELLAAYGEVIPVTMIALLLGVPAAMADQLLRWSHAMVAMYQFQRDRAIEEQAAAAASAFAGFMRGYVEERRQRPEDDLISHLIAAEAAGDRLSTDELISTCILLLNAGHEATVHAIGNGVKALLAAELDPAAWLSTPARIEALVEELLRFDPPLHLFKRHVLADLELGGQVFRRGEVVGLLLGAANHDPARFAAPERLDPERGGRGHLAFGAGLHFCLGAPLARLELQVVLPVLLRRLPGLRLAGRPHYADRYHFRSLARLDLVW